MHFALYLQQTATPEQIQQAEKILAVFLPIVGLFILVGLAVVIVPCWFICRKAGFSPWLSLLNLIPIGNLILLYVLAFADWKVAPLPPQAWGPPPPYPPPPQPPYPPRS
jgi:hypothetical protein